MKGLDQINAAVDAFNVGKTEPPAGDHNHHFTHSHWNRNFSVSTGVSLPPGKEETVEEFLGRAALAPDIHKFSCSAPEGDVVTISGWTGRRNP